MGHAPNRDRRACKMNCASCPGHSTLPRARAAAALVAPRARCVTRSPGTRSAASPGTPRSGARAAPPSGGDAPRTSWRPLFLDSRRQPPPQRTSWNSRAPALSRKACKCARRCCRAPCSRPAADYSLPQLVKWQLSYCRAVVARFKVTIRIAMTRSLNCWPKRK